MGSITNTSVKIGQKGENHPAWKGGLDISKRKLIKKEYDKRERMAAIQAMGGKCIRCGFSDCRALQIDHINGGGTKELRERKFHKSYNKHVLESFIRGENKYQLLCANCNWIKRAENKEHRFTK